MRNCVVLSLHFLDSTTIRGWTETIVPSSPLSSLVTHHVTCLLFNQGSSSIPGVCISHVNPDFSM